MTHEKKNGLPILIAGGGIGALSAALSLLKRGFDVEVYEQAAQLKEVGAGIQISPNGSRALDALGVFEQLKPLSCKAEEKNMRHWKTGRTWPMLDLGAAGVAAWGYPYLTVYRPDLLGVLVDAVRSLKGDAIHLSSCGVSFEQTADRVTLVMEDGRRVEGSALIGADGIHSKVRQTMFGAAQPAFTGMVTWRATVPMSSVPERMHRPVATNWIGPSGHVVTYPLQRGQLMNLVATVVRRDWQQESWTAQGTNEECARDFSGWHEDIHILIKAAPLLAKWALATREPLLQWASGRVCLIGDAAHSTLPGLAQGGVMAIEDGLILGRCMEHHSDSIPTALKRLETIRAERTRKIVLESTINQGRFHGSELAEEDTADAYVAREWSREALRERYEWLFSYKADEVAV